MLKDILDKRQCFKLVCGCGNEDAVEIEKLVALYSKAGCNFFDLCAKPEIVDAAKRGLEFAGIKEDRYLCVSVGIDGDPHTNKAIIDKEKCIGCSECKKICPHNAIEDEDNICKINSKRCIGCQQCLKVCKNNAISLKAYPQDLEKILPPLIEKGIDCIELHIIGEDEKEVDEKWDYLNKTFDGFLCMSIDRSKLGDEKLLKRVKRLLDKRKSFTTLIQADGIAMSGNSNSNRTTLQAIAITDFFESKKLNAYIMSSGGTNAKTTELLKMFDIKVNALAVGSYARKIVQEFTKRDDFLTNKKVFNEALKIARDLVEISYKYMQ